MTLLLCDQKGTVLHEVHTVALARPPASYVYGNVEYRYYGLADDLSAFVYRMR